MKKITLALAAAAFLGGATAVIADNATMHGQNFRHEGTAIHVDNFDVTLDGRTITASEATYHPDTGMVDLKGNVELHFGPNVVVDPAAK